VESVAIITAVAGGYDWKRTDEVRCPDVDYFFFTDPESADTCPDYWHRVPLPGGPDMHPRRRAKFPKLNPHRFPVLRSYQHIIWVDGSITIQKESFAEEILSYLTNGMVVTPHPDDRDCAYGEATIRPPKYEEEPLDDQVAYYRSRGFPEDFGLYETGVSARNMRNVQVEILGRAWENQVASWSIQDQVSLPFALWATGYQPDVLPKSFREFGWVNINAHRSEL